MPVELILVLGLAVIFVVPILLDINVGIVAFIAAFLLGTWVMDMSAREIAAGFPDTMFLMLVGITLLLGIANQNGTVDWLVSRLVRLARGRLVLLPWVLFGIAVLTSTMGPGAAPVLFIIGAGFIGRHQLNPLLVAAMIIHGNQSAGYSPIAPYGVVIGELLADAGLAYSPIALYLGVVGFHIVLAGMVFVLLGGLKLRGVRVEADPIEAAAPINTEQILTLIGFLVLVLSVLVWRLNLGFVALTISFGLLLIAPKDRRQNAVSEVAWPIVLVIAGVLTYVHLLQEANATVWLAHQAEALGSAALIGLLLCFIVAIVTGVASTMGTIGILVPLAAPLLATGQLDTTGLLTAMSISAAVSDISPFSTYGALFIATASQVVDRDRLLKPQLLYTLIMVSAMPVAAWLVFVIPTLP